MSDLVERLRWINDNAAGEAFLPDGWRELAELLPDIIAALDAQPVGLDVGRLARALAKLTRTEMFEDMGEGAPMGLYVRWDEVAFLLHENTGTALASEPQP